MTNEVADRTADMVLYVFGSAVSHIQDTRLSCLWLQPAIRAW